MRWANTSVLWCVVIVGIALGASVPKCFGQGPCQLAKLIASDGAPADQFGDCIALSGDAALVGATGDDDHGAASGSAYVFEKTGAVWTQVAKLTASDGAPTDWFGSSVALSGDVALVAAHGDADHGENTGSAYVFERIGGLWTQVAKLTASDGAASDYFGWSVAVSPDTALVGAPSDDDAGQSSGSTYVFEKIGGVWTQVAKLTASDGAPGDSFGKSACLSGDVALVGASWDDDEGGNSGSVYVFEKIGGVWTQAAKLTASDAASGDWFGGSVALSGDVALVGAVGDDDHGEQSGSAYVFEKIAGVWTEVAKLDATDGARYDYFGYSVGVSVDVAVVGAYGDDDVGTFSGSAYVFERIFGVWTQVGKLTASDGAAWDWFGICVALSGDVALVGTRYGESAYLFAVDGEDCNNNAIIDACDIAWGVSEDVNGNGVPDECECPGDVDQDSDTDHSDLGILLSDWGCSGGSCEGDLDGDGDTDHADLYILLTDWGCTL